MKSLSVLSTSGLRSNVKMTCLSAGSRLTPGAKTVAPADAWSRQAPTARPRVVGHAVSPAGAIPFLSPPAGAVSAADGALSADAFGLLAMGALAGMFAGQLFGPSRHHAAACQLSAAMGAIGVALLPGAVQHWPVSLAVASTTAGVGAGLMRPLLAQTMSASDARAWAALSTAALTLVGLTACQGLSL